MPTSISKATETLSVRAWIGDAKTLLAFDLLDRSRLDRFAGFTIECAPGALPSYYLHNSLRYKTPALHAQMPTETPTSTANAPLHKFRWLHVPGSLHQGIAPFYGKYRYTVTARFCDEHGALLPIDESDAASVNVDVGPFATKQLKLGFTRGFVQSQAFVDNFGHQALIAPKQHDLQFDTSVVASTNDYGEQYTWEEQWEWLGFTARARVYELLDAVIADASLSVDVFAYDLSEPDIIGRLLRLARAGRIRMILDNAALHHSSDGSKPEDQFEQLFARRRRSASALKRGKFGRYSHDKVIVVRKNGKPVSVLTGSTNFSINGFYVNANHVIRFDDPQVAGVYGDVFDAAWQVDVKAAAFEKLPESQKTFSFSNAKTPRTDVTFAPHTADIATANLDALVARIAAEEKSGGSTASVLFAVMGLDKGTGPVLPALNALHQDASIFTYGISDSPAGIALYAPGKRTGLLVTGKPTSVRLPPPFNQVRSLGLLDHQIHHKFVVCGFRGADPVVYCGSSNLTAGGEENNGDNLLAIHDAAIATAFAIEAVALVDHFAFLDGYAKPKAGGAAPQADRRNAAQNAGWFLSTGGGWAKKYFDENDLHYADRVLFA
jgi:phospholipase D-like protein